MIITFTLGFVAAVITGALVWMFVTLYKLKKKLTWTDNALTNLSLDQNRFSETYWRTREDDQRNMFHRFDDMQRHIETYFVTKEELKDNKKTLLKG